jgi:hypothetical protein
MLDHIRIRKKKNSGRFYNPHSTDRDGRGPHQKPSYNVRRQRMREQLLPHGRSSSSSPNAAIFCSSFLSIFFSFCLQKVEESK